MAGNNWRKFLSIIVMIVLVVAITANSSYVYIYAQEETDMAPPEIFSTNPEDRQTGVRVSEPIWIQFTEQMDASTISVSTIVVNDGTKNIAGDVSMDDTLMLRHLSLPNIWTMLRAML